MATKGIVAAVMAGLLLSGCASAGGCMGFKKVEVSEHDRMTRGTKQGILGNNLQGEELGCWKASS